MVLNIILIILAVAAAIYVYFVRVGKRIYRTKISGNFIPGTIQMVIAKEEEAMEPSVGDTGFALPRHSSDWVHFYANEYQPNGGSFGFVESKTRAEHLKKPGQCRIKVVAKTEDTYTMECYLV